MWGGLHLEESRGSVTAKCLFMGKDAQMTASNDSLRRLATIDAESPPFGLPSSLWIPIAAASVAGIEKYVGKILETRTDPETRRVNAVKVRTRLGNVVREPNVPLWESSLARTASDQLYPANQVWVHVDYTGYRQAYIDFEMPAITKNCFLDHIQNRKAIGLRDNSHPYLRLCPVDSGVNTSGGHSSGGEGMEKKFLRNHGPLKAQHTIIYADPMDLTKMLNIKPGTQFLAGVGETQRLFYPPRPKG
jgi:hypothetical protein